MTQQISGINTSATVNKITDSIADWSVVLETRMELKDHCGNDFMFELKTEHSRSVLSIYSSEFSNGEVHFELEVDAKIVDRYLLGMSNRVQMLFGGQYHPDQDDSPNSDSKSEPS